MMKIYKAIERGHVNYDWLDSWFSFSFGEYYNPQMMNYGALRVLNDDTIAPGMGFPSHPHREMEIITIVTKGELRHEDDTGKSAILKPGWVQVMSAGTGIIHSEFNNSKKEKLELFQIWIYPKSSIKPRHEERKFKKENGITVLAGKGGIEINQDAKVSVGRFKTGKTIKLKPEPEKGLYLMVIEGKIKSLDAIELLRRDAASFEEETSFIIEKDASLLLIEVPILDT